jgi:hypothetical protein
VFISCSFDCDPQLRQPAFHVLLNRRRPDAKELSRLCLCPTGAVHEEDRDALLSRQ